MRIEANDEVAAYFRANLPAGPGFHPAWEWRAPPGIGDAMQFVMTTQTLMPYCVEGAAVGIPIDTMQYQGPRSRTTLQGNGNFTSNPIPMVYGSMYDMPLVYQNQVSEPELLMYPTPNGGWPLV
jgi:hypothetical protein